MINLSKDQSDEHRYDDIMGRERPLKEDGRPMSVKDRAAQFSPFAALTGFEDMVDGASRERNETV